ncbi:cbe6a5f5-1de4-4ccd-8fed-1a373e498a39-CDS [Sclerotinia trifoliorum]|uniref:Cbe6a5f5-1de4-4ccd-8fed-1a373e498a39-CDS n=1 Tax=Sclerotinia trifoliorum TaxID=28548 RepID=A0A8H2VYF7_9HELO|nr:cbe6a5f5-1de4-4ccd-8fed-1a373e498a39-CDS [Sclerotinia trifoliorum]
MMSTTSSPTCILVYLLSLLASNNNLTVAFHAIYSISTILPLFIILFRTSTAFFLYDFVNFPNNIMSVIATIINILVPGKNIRIVAIWQFILAIFPIPGVLLGIYLINRIGRKYTGILGFAGYITLSFIIGATYSTLTTPTNLSPCVYSPLWNFCPDGSYGPGSNDRTY